MEIETLKEVPAPPTELPPCDIRYITISLHKSSIDGELFWAADSHKTLQRAEADAEYCVPGTLRIFEIPERAT